MKKSWDEDVIYFVLTDRFFDGDAENNNPKGCAPGLHDPQQKDLGKYHGGDLRGLELALRSNYFNDLGVSVIWITPPISNVWYAPNEEKTGYHGYWTRDFLDIDPHLVSRKSLSGEPYPEGREGRLSHYKDFVKLAHSKGIKVIQDAVCNHIGPLFYYDANNNKKLDLDDKAEWIQGYKNEGIHENAAWAEIAKWNMGKAEPSGPLTIFGKKYNFSGILGNLEAYTRKGFNGDSLGKSDGEEIIVDFLANRDIDTSPNGPYFDKIVDEFVEIYAFYIEECGIDGLRIDTIKHVHHEFWSTFTEKLRSRIGERSKEILLFGEVYDGNPEKLGSYTYHTDWQKNKMPALDGVLNFQLCFTARDFFRKPKDEYGSTGGIHQTMYDLHYGKNHSGRPFYNSNPGTTGLNSRDASITFLENHDGINRFWVGEVTERRNLLTNAFVMLSGGIPCLYYGTEGGIHDKDCPIGKDSETGRSTFITSGNRAKVKKVRQSKTFQAIASLASLRQKHPILRTGSTVPLYPEEEGLLLFARYTKDSPSKKAIIVAFNLRTEEVAIQDEGLALRDREGKSLLPENVKKLSTAPIKELSEKEITTQVDWKDGTPYAKLKLPPRSVTVWLPTP